MVKLACYDEQKNHQIYPVQRVLIWINGLLITYKSTPELNLSLPGLRSTK